MKRLLSGRCWMVLMIFSTGVTPVLFDIGCLQTQAERQAFLEAKLSDPWAAVPGSPDYPDSFLANLVSTQVNPDADGNGNPDATDLQRVMNTAFASLSTWIRSQIGMHNPSSWSDVGRPR